MLNNYINILIFSFFLIILFLNIIPNSYDVFYLNTFLFLDFVALTSFSLKKEKFSELVGQKIKFSTIFLLGFLIVHFQGYLDLFLGIINENFGLFWINKNNIIKNLVYSSLALNAFFVGYMIYKNNTNFKRTHTLKYIYDIKILSSLNFIFFIIFLTQIDSSFLSSTEYGGREIKPILGYSSLFFETSFLAIVIHVIRNLIQERKPISFSKYLKSFGFSFYVFIIYIVCILLSGDRGPLIYLLLSFLIGYVLTSNFKLSTIKFYSICLVGAVFISFLGIVRKLSYEKTIVKETLIEDNYNRYYPKSILPFTKELATSIRTVNVATNYVPEKVDYFYGGFTFQNLSLIIPGFNNFINKVLNIKFENMTSAKFLTYMDLGKDATWGIGTSAVADVYLDFGSIGIILIFFSFGYISRKIEVAVTVFSVYKASYLILYVTYFGFGLYLSRSNLFVPLVKFPYILGFYLIVILVNKKRLSFNV